MRVSIVIPMRNEAGFVARCLDSVLAQVAGQNDVEILCVDGRSADGTRATVDEYARRDPRVRLIDNPNRIVPTAMNLGIAAARGDIIIRLDCHSEYAPDYIDRCVAVLQRTGADNVGGYLRTLPGKDSAIGQAIAAATSSRFGVGGSAFRTGGDEREVDTVPFGCFRRDVFERFGGYDERLVRNQDIELNARIRRGGGRVVISPEIKLTYYNRSTFAGLRQQAYHNGLWNPYTVWLVGGGLQVRHFVPLLFVVALIVLPLAGVLWWPAWVAWGGMMAVYLAAGLWMAAKAGRAAGASTLLTLVAFAQLHVAYGIGSLIGLVTAPLKFGLRRASHTVKVLPDRRD